MNTASSGVTTLLLHNAPHHGIVARANYREGSCLGNGSWLDDASLFRGDLLKTVAQIFLMIIAHVRDDGYAWIHNVGCVQTPTQPNFEHRNLDALLREIVEGDGSDHLEVGRVTIESESRSRI